MFCYHGPKRQATASGAEFTTVHTKTYTTITVYLPRMVFYFLLSWSN